MKRSKTYLAQLLCGILALSLAPIGVAQKRTKHLKIQGYITEFHSPTSFEIEDDRILRDESVVLEHENESSDIRFKQSDLRIGTLIQIAGPYDEQTNELRATKLKVDLAQFRQIDVTTILDRRKIKVV